MLMFEKKKYVLTLQLQLLISVGKTMEHFLNKVHCACDRLPSTKLLYLHVP
jgi:hypothetical protein